jgi:putative addiction module killer protein
VAVITVRQYVDLQGASPFERWLNRLDDVAAARVLTTVTRIGQGNFSSVKGVGGGVFESRIDFGPGLRVYFGKDGATLVILLGGGTKKHQARDIADAHRFWQNYKQRR